jgi:predicted transcriptional regulator
VYWHSSIDFIGPSMPRLDDLDQLGARERQIMEALFRLGRASVAEVRDAIASPPTYSSVRGMLGLLEQKGFITHEREGLRYVYAPTFAPANAKRRALTRVVTTFFSGSPERAVSALLGLDEETPIDLDTLRRLVAKAGRK